MSKDTGVRLENITVARIEKLRIRRTSAGVAGRACSKRFVRVLLVCFLLFACGKLMCSTASAQWGRRSMGSGQPLDLVHYDDELITYLDKIKKHIKDKEFKEATELLQALLDRRDTGFFPVEKGKRFVSFHYEILKVLKLMMDDPIGRRHYLSLYNPQANQLLYEAKHKNDLQKLRRLAEKYCYTDAGPKAMEMLATMDFDQGKFSLAAWRWSEMRRAFGTSSPDVEPPLLAKIAISMHLAGENVQAVKASSILKEKYPDAMGLMGGMEQNLPSFTAKVLSMPVMANSGGWISRQDGNWPGLWAFPGHRALMDESTAVIIPRWGAIQKRGGDLSGSLIARRDLLSVSRGSSVSTGVTLRGGQVLSRRSQNYKQKSTLAIPSSIHPVIVDDLVIYRTDEGITAVDMYTGKLVWRTFSLPLYRKKAVRTNYSSNSSGMAVLDYGRYAVTVGNRNVYVLSDFRKNLRYYSSGVLTKEQRDALADNSCLVAISLDKEGARVWRLGRGEGDSDITRGCKFLSAPTLSGGYLYVLVKFMEAYHVLCLDPEDSGSLVWSSRISQLPIFGGGRNNTIDPRLGVGTPPAIYDGRVYVLTNAGVIASLDAGTGSPFWAYQYSSTVNTGSTSSNRSVVKLAGMNPIIVSRGQVTVMPSDSNDVMSFASVDGKLRWSSSRKGMRHLSGIDENRVLVSGSGLAVFSTATGKLLHEQIISDVFGRPAVTDKSVLASKSGGLGGLYRLDLDTYTLTTVGPAEPGSLLGNLLSIKGNLFASNALGVCAYVSYDQARLNLVKRLVAAIDDSDKCDRHYDLGHLAFGARRYGQALKDFQQCRTLAETLGEKGEVILTQLRPRIYRTYVALGNASGDKNLDEMGAMFTKAQAFAATKQDKAHLLLRMAKYYERVGLVRKDSDALIKAVRLATDITRLYGDEMMVDLKVGLGANEAVRTESSDGLDEGRVISERFIANILKTHGRECYTVFDNEAGKALAEAKSKDDPDAMVTVAKTWKLSKWRSEALFCAAEIYYLRARQLGNGPAARPLFSIAMSCLSAVRSDEDSEFAISAVVAVASIYAKGNKYIAAKLTLEQIRDTPDETRVKFADISGSLGELRMEIDQTDDDPDQPGTPVSIDKWITGSLREQFALRGVRIIRDQFSSPLHIGQNVLALKGNQMILLDTAAANADSSIVWSGLTSVDTGRLRAYSSTAMSTCLLGSISKDRSTIVVADWKSATGFDSKTAKRKWHVNWRESLKFTSAYYMAVG
ncbi:MAG TPA: hypothetical protein ENL03_06520, partial [Phycisphaerae bacterium]|nr:hypothetical protein [Phycisphaerae bacterium]